jgi:hypothetical protein
MSNPKNSKFSEQLKILKDAIDEYQLGRKDTDHAWVQENVPRNYNIKINFKGTKYFCKKSKIFPKKINFLNFYESFTYIKNLFSNEKNNENGELKLVSLKLDLICKLTFTPLEYPCRGNNCFHLGCFSLKSFLRTTNKKEFKKIYCPHCKEPIQVGPLYDSG